MKTSTKQTFRIYLKHAFRYKISCILVLIFLVSTVTIGMIVPIFYSRFFNIIAESSPASEIIQKLLMLLLTIIGIKLISWCLWRLVFFIYIYFSAKSVPDVAKTSFENIHLRSYRFFTNNFVGSLVKKANRFVRAYEGLFDELVWDFTPLFVELIVILIVLSFRSIKLGLILLAWAVVFMVINYIFTRYKLKYDIKSTKADSKVTAHLADTITNSINIKLFSGYGMEMKRFGKLLKEQFRIKKFTWNLEGYFEAGQGLLMLGLEFVMFYVALKLWKGGIIKVGGFALIQIYLITLLRKLWGFGRMLRHVYAHLADAEEMTEILKEPLEVKDLRNAKKLKVSRGAIEFNSVRFGYKKGSNVFPAVDVHIKPQEKVGIIGPSGSGKSTFVKLLFRFFDLKRGQILIDGQNVKHVTQESLRNKISLVPQDPVLFHRSLLENIRYGNMSATDEEVMRAAKLSHSDEFIQKLPLGYDTLVGERGIKLSGGERQRIAIARAILKNAPILVLDEATSSLDSESELMIQDALESLMKDKTVIVIAHRLSTIMKMDRIIVMKDGRIEEEGTHGELVQKKGSLYRRLWELQAKGFVGE